MSTVSLSADVYIQELNENDKLKETITEQQKEIQVVLKERREGDAENDDLKAVLQQVANALCSNEEEASVLRDHTDKLIKKASSTWKDGKLSQRHCRQKTIEIEKLKEEVVNIVKIKNKQIEKEKSKYEAMCNEQSKSDCAKYIQELQEENKELKEDITNHPDFEEIATDWYERHNWMVDKDEFTELKEENKKLKELNEQTEKQIADHEELQDTAEDVLQQVADALCGEGEEADSICCWGYTDKLIKKATELKEERNYWKNFALVYWSDDQLGNLGETEKDGSNKVWDEALEKVNDNHTEISQEELDELNKKCMAD